MSITVKNISRTPQPLHGGGVIAHGETATVEDCEHTRAQIADGALLELDTAPADEPDNKPARTPRRKED